VSTSTVPVLRYSTWIKKCEGDNPRLTASIVALLIKIPPFIKRRKENWGTLWITDRDMLALFAKISIEVYVFWQE